MTVRSSIDHARLLEEQLAQASTDLLRELLQTFINTLLSRRGRRGLRRGVRHDDPGPGEPAQRVPAPRLRHPRPAASTWRSRSCARAPTSPSGCSSGASEPSGR